MRTTRPSVGLRVALAAGLFLAFAVFGVWRWSARDHTGVGIAGAFVWIILFANVSAAQNHCQRRFRWNDHTARYTRKAAVALKRKAEATAVLAETDTGERARAYYQRRADRLHREAEQREGVASCYEVQARWWDFLQ